VSQLPVLPVTVGPLHTRDNESKTGAVLRTSTPINELWANTNGECKTYNDGDPSSSTTS
jgi:hypothetical protein